MAQIDERQALIQDQQLPNMEMPVAVRVRKVHKRIRRAVTPLRVLFTAAVVALCMTLLYNQMHLTKLTKEIGEQKTTLENLQSEYVSLKTQQEQALSISNVEE